MGVFVVPAANALPAFAPDYHHPVRFKTSATLHFNPLRAYYKGQLHCSKDFLVGGSCTTGYLIPCGFRTRNRSLASRSFNRKRSRPFLAGSLDDFRSNKETVEEFGGFLGRSLKRGASRIGTGKGTQERVIERSSSAKQEPQEKVSENKGPVSIEIVENANESPLKPLQSSNLASSMIDRLLTAAQKQASKVKGLASNTFGTNYFSSVDASPGTQLLPFVGNSLLGIGSIVLVTVALVSWWKKFELGSKVFKLGKPESTPPPTSAVTDAQAAVAAPIALSLFLQSDLKKKESAEWLNMVLGKVWNLYRRKLEGALVDAIQPVIDEIPEKPPYVDRVVLKQFFLGDEPVTLRTIERRTSRRAYDLQYHLGLRYTGNSRMVFSITMRFGFLPITFPVVIRGLDLDGEVWVKLRLIPTEPWVGTATWAFVSQPKVTLALAPFRLLNLMAVPFLNIFLKKLLTQDLPLLFVRPNKQVVNYLKGKTAGPLAKDFKDVVGLKGFAGELSITLFEARKLNYFPIGKSDPYVVFLLGEQVIRSKRNSKTSTIGPPGAPVWNQDFRMLVVNPETQKLRIVVRDSVGYFGLTTITVGSVEVPLRNLQDTVPVDEVLPLKTSRWFFLGGNAGEILVRLTYKAYVEDEEEPGTGDRPLTNKVWNEIGNFISKEMEETDVSPEKRQLRDAIVMSVDAQKGADGFRFSNPLMTQSANKVIDETTIRNEGVANPSTVTEVPESPALVENPALKEQEKREDKSWGLRLLRFTEQNSALVWLAIVTGIALLVALDLNLSNLFNP